MGSNDPVTAERRFSGTFVRAHTPGVEEGGRNSGRIVGNTSVKGRSSLEPRIGNSSTDCEVVDHLLRKRARVLARRGPLFVLPELRGATKVLFAGFGNHRSRLAPVLVLRCHTA